MSGTMKGASQGTVLKEQDDGNTIIINVIAEKPDEERISHAQLEI